MKTRTFLLVTALAAALAGRASAKDIAPLDDAAKPTEDGKYPKENVPEGQTFDGSFRSVVGYRSEDGRFSAAIWESGPGVLETDGYPNDEFCHVLEGKLVITNASGSTEEFGPGDSFVIPKGWVGTWDMKTRFKKRFVAFEEKPAAP